MAKSKKRKQLEEGGVLNPNARLAKDQVAALESLTPEEITHTINARNKLKAAFHIPAIPGTTGMKTNNTTSTAK